MGLAWHGNGRIYVPGMDVIVPGLAWQRRGVGLVYLCGWSTEFARPSELKGAKLALFIWEGRARVVPWLCVWVGLVT